MPICLALPSRQTVTLSFSCPVDLMVTLDAPASFTVVALGISSQIGVSSMAITFAIAYCFVWNLCLTLRMKLITRSIRLPGLCCARELRLRKVNPCLFVKRTTQPLLALKSCWDISSLSSEPAVTSVPFDDLSSRQMISPFLLMARLEMRWPHALISWIHLSTLSSSSVERCSLPPPCSLFLGFTEVSSSAFSCSHSQILCVHTKFSCCGFLAVTFCISNRFDFCAYTIAVSFLSLSTCFTALHTRMIIFLTRSTGRFSGIVDTFVVHDFKNDWKKSNCWHTAILCQCYTLQCVSQNFWQAVSEIHLKVPKFATNLTISFCTCQSNNCELEW